MESTSIAVDQQETSVAVDQQETSIAEDQRHAQQDIPTLPIQTKPRTWSPNPTDPETGVIFADITQSSPQSSVPCARKRSADLAAAATPGATKRALRAVGWTPRNLVAGNLKGFAISTPRTETKLDSEHASRPAALSSIWEVTKSILDSPRRKWRTRLVMVCLSLLLLAEGALMIWFSFVQREYTTALEQKNEAGFYRGLMQLLAVICVAMPVVALSEWTKGCIILGWRSELTEELLTGYLQDTKAYYALKQCKDGIDNPDQRICQDVAGFSLGMIETISALVLALLTVVSGAAVLISISPELFLFLVLYAVCGTMVMLRIFGVPLMGYQQKILCQEASLRFDLVRARENAEAIAFYQGATFESSRSKEHLGDLIKTLYKRLGVMTGSHAFKRGYTWITFILPAIIMGPKYLRGEIDFGAITQVGFLFSSLLEAMLVLVNMLDAIAGVGAQAIRLTEMKKAVDKIKDSESDAISDSDKKIVLEGLAADCCSSDAVRLQLDAVSLKAPQLWDSEQPAKELVSNISLTLKDGNSLLISGFSGLGKSSLLRAIAGLWRNGEGRILRVPIEYCFFLPQQPYMCLGTLREQALYPGGGMEVDDTELKNVLEEVNLGHLVQRHGFDTAVDFASVLSLGEQQRLAFARLLLRNNVALALLDESTSALDEENEARLYGLMKDRVGCYVSVGHRSQLRSFHTHSLQLQGVKAGGSSGKMEELAEAQQIFQQRAAGEASSVVSI
eukprot:TRINITY_DN19408_c0_g1_i1.p1 TRINITY_DN19408_c0_g1~~TRINITY_DN19408_c0_g1_i1.p1  ORF type:complete len:734 (+),score=159.83 TRINITY_DN19408_c0_g1_i1:125-2326(+)